MGDSLERVLARDPAALFARVGAEVLLVWSVFARAARKRVRGGAANLWRWRTEMIQTVVEAMRLAEQATNPAGQSEFVDLKLSIAPIRSHAAAAWRFLLDASEGRPEVEPFLRTWRLAAHDAIEQGIDIATKMRRR